MALVGDFAKLRSLRERIDRLGSDATKEELSKNLAEEARSLILQGFRKETDPYGKRWPAKVFGDGKAVLVRTNELRSGWHPSRISASGFTISPSATAMSYAKHTLGTGLWGPHKAPIVPKNGPFLAFFVKGYITRQARMSVRPVKGSKTWLSAKQYKQWGSATKKLTGSTIFVRSVKGSPPRLMVPNRERGLPRDWKVQFVEATNEFIARQLRGKR